MIKKLATLTFLPLLKPLTPFHPFSSKKISDIIEQLSDKINQQQIATNLTQQTILKNYIQLTEQSYLEHLLHQNKNNTQIHIDPHLILMILPTLQKQQTIREHLILLSPHLSLLNAKELTLFYQYLLAHKLAIKPKIPPPKSLRGSESLLVLLAEIYHKDFLIEWLKQVPLYDGSNVYLITMGAFSIIGGLSEQAKLKNQALIGRCCSRIKQMYLNEESEVRLGMILLGFEMDVSLAEQLLLLPYSIDFFQIDGIKASLLLIQLDNYIRKKYSQIRSRNPSKIKQQQKQQQFEDDDVQVDEGVDRPKVINMNTYRYIYNPLNTQEIKYKLEQMENKILKYLFRIDWKTVIKLHTLIKFYDILKDKKLEKQWLKFSEKLINFTIKKDQLTLLNNLTTSELINIVQCLEIHKINKPQLLKNILILLTDRLQTASNQQMIRLARCLVTYVRQVEDYLIHFRSILQRRKYIFSAQDIISLNTIFKRVQVLFPKPLNY